MSPGKKKGLGRGLSALFGDETPKNKTKEINSINKISISDLTRNPNQPRHYFDETKLNELSNSIKKNGIIQPIAVRPKKSETNRDGFRYLCPSGKKSQIYVWLYIVYMFSKSS